MRPRIEVERIVSSSDINADVKVDDTEKRKLDAVSKAIASGIKPEDAYKINKLR